MSSFLAWQGWAGVGAIAQLLSLATIVAAAWRYVLQRRQFPLFQLEWDFIGTAQVDGHSYHVVEFRNVGRGTGHITSFYLGGARAHPHPEFLAPRSIAAGDTFKLLITSPNLANAWARTIYRTHDDASRAMVRWQPLIRSGPMFEQWVRDVDDRAARSYYERVRDHFKPKPVAPGSTTKATVTLRHRDRIPVVFSGGPPDQLYWDVYVGQNDPPALPWVPPAPSGPQAAP